MAKLMSMISTGWPWPAAMFRSRPSAIKWIRLPCGRTYSSTNSRTFRFVFASFSRSAFEISLSKWPAFPRTTPSLRRGKCAAVTMSLQPVAEMMKSAIRDALDIERTSKPSIVAWIAFRHNDAGAHPAGAHRAPTTRPSVARDDERAARDQQVRGRHEAVNGALTRPVAVVEQVFHLGIVHIDDREAKGAIPFHRPEPDDARRRLLVSPPHAREQFGSLRVQQEDEVRAVVNHEVRFQIEDFVEVGVILLRRFPLLRVNFEAVGFRKRRGDAVVGGEGIA